MSTGLRCSLRGSKHQRNSANSATVEDGQVSALVQKWFAEYDRQLPLAVEYVKTLDGCDRELDPEILAAGGAIATTLGRAPTVEEMEFFCFRAFPNSKATQRLRRLLARDLGLDSSDD
jgi:hypothetical protein